FPLFTFHVPLPLLSHSLPLSAPLQSAMSSSIGTYLVLVTAGLSLTYLSFLLYTAYGLGALRVAAPFIGTIALVFAAAHCLDKAQHAEDAKTEAASLERASGAGAG
ncbi:unnamed protein product, partial [Pylaiella littoralis]